MMAMANTFGISSMFFTFSPKAEMNPFSFQISQVVGDPTKFPVNFGHVDNSVHRSHEEVLDIMRLPVGDKFFFSGGKEFDLSRKALKILNRTNPVASTIAFQKLTSLIFEILFGISQGKDVKKTVPFTPRTTTNNGNPLFPFGAISNIDGSVEEQKRGDLHGHYMITGGLFNIRLVEKNLKNPESRLRIAKLYESIISSSLDPTIMLKDMVDLYWRQKIKSSLLDTNIKNPSSGEEFFSQASERATSLQLHVHQHQVGGTCTVGNKGKIECRLSQPQALGNSTKFYALQKSMNPEKEYVYNRVRT